MKHLRPLELFELKEGFTFFCKRPHTDFFVREAFVAAVGKHELAQRVFVLAQIVENYLCHSYHP